MNTLWQEMVQERSYDLRDFATGDLSAKQLLRYMREEGSPLSGPLDKVFRERGVTETRQLARKALRRRKIKI